MQVARAAGIPVSFDVNHRATLWPDEVAAPVLARLAAAADLVFAGPEAALVLGRPPVPPSFEEGELLARELAKRGPRARSWSSSVRSGRWRLSGDKKRTGRPPSQSPWSTRWVPATRSSPATRARSWPASRCPTRCTHRQRVRRRGVRRPGDWEGLPTRAELVDVGGDQEIVR